MTKDLHPDIEILQLVAKRLGTLREKVVFVGGATTTLYIDDEGAPDSVATQDVDCVIEITGHLSYQSLERQLRKLGFKQPVDEPNAPICRWGCGEVLVDIMPSDPKILGFSNRWYAEGISNRETLNLPDKTTISIFRLPYFIASKLEALKDRGGNDLRLSHDLEDIVLVVSGSSQAVELIVSSPGQVRKYIQAEFKRLLKDPLFREAVGGILAERRETSGRLQKFMDKVSVLTKL